MPAERDPRTDPAKGDELDVTIDSGDTLTLNVTAVNPYYVCFLAGNGAYESNLRIKAWRLLTRNARVVARADSKEADHGR